MVGKGRDGTAAFAPRSAAVLRRRREPPVLGAKRPRLRRAVVNLASDAAQGGLCWSFDRRASGLTGEAFGEPIVRGRRQDPVDAICRDALGGHGRHRPHGGSPG
jgi:hypothetical protein